MKEMLVKPVFVNSVFLGNDAEEQFIFSIFPENYDLSVLLH